MQNRESKLWLIFSISVGIIGLVIYIGFFVLLYFQEHFNWSSPIVLQNSSSIGSFLSGAVGSLWILVSVILLYQTLRLQRKEFLTNRFETTYFNMLSNLQELISSMSSDTEVIIESDKQGKAYLHYTFNKLKRTYEKKLKPRIQDIRKNEKSEDEKEKEIVNIIVLEYEKLFQYNSFNLGHYFRYVYNIMKYVLTEVESEIEKEKYFGILQAQMSNDELGLLFYNSLSKFSVNKKGEPVFRNWLDKYKIIENIDGNYVFDDFLINKYSATKFWYKINPKIA